MAPFPKSGAYALAFGLVIWGVKDAFASWRTDHMGVIHQWSVVISYSTIILHV